MDNGATVRGSAKAMRGKAPGAALAYRPPVADWTPITIEYIEPVGEPTPDRVALVFHLSSEPDPLWRGFFDSAPWKTTASRLGSTMEKPRVRGSTISVVVTEADVDRAKEQIESARKKANGEYQTRVIDPQIERETSDAAQSEAVEAKRQELEDRLNTDE
jgi:hypothetical protein